MERVDAQALLRDAERLRRGPATTGTPRRSHC
jgi:hypothetical protein